MGNVYIQTCDLDGGSLVDVHADSDGDIWIFTSGHGSVMLGPDSARDLAAELVRLADQHEVIN